MATGDKLVNLDGLKTVYDKVNGDVGDLKSASDNLYSDTVALGCGDLIAHSYISLPVTLRGITISRAGDAFNIKGTATGGVLQRIVGSENTLPAGMTPGKTYRALISFDSASPKSLIRLTYNVGETASTIGNFSSDTTFTLPAGATGFRANVYVDSGVTVDENVTFRVIGTKTNAELTEILDGVETAVDAIAKNNIASAYATGEAYSAGEYFTDGGYLYRVTEDIASADNTDIDAVSKVAVTTGTELSALNDTTKKLSEDVSKLGFGDLLAQCTWAVPTTYRGITFSKVGDRLKIQGTTNDKQSSMVCVIDRSESLPEGMEIGVKYKFVCSYDNPSPISYLRINRYTSSGTSILKDSIRSDTEFTLPEGTIGISIHAGVYKSNTVDESVAFSIISGAKSNAKLAEEIDGEALARQGADDALDARVTALEDKTVAITPNILFTYPLGWRKGKYSATGSFSSNADDASTCLPVPVIPGSEKLKVTPPEGYAVSVTAFTAIPSMISGNATWNASILIGQTAGATDEALTIDAVPGHLYYITTTYPYASIQTEQPVTIECVNPGTGNVGPFDMNVVPILGQSLSVATTHATPAIHTQPVRGGYMLDTGVYQVDNTMGNMHGIVQLVEGSDSWLHDSTTGDVRENIENSAWGCAEAVSLLMGRNAEGHKQLYFTAGQSGHTITDQFDSEMTATARVFASVRKYSQYPNIGCPTIIWMHGEADSHSMTVQEYKDYLVSGIDIIRKLAMAIFGQGANVKCIAYQTARHQHTDHVSSDAQYELMRDSDDFAVSCPAFVSIFGPNDSTHSSNWGQYLMGRYHGIQLHDWIINGHKNVGVMPMKNGVTWSGNTIKIKFMCERPPLRFVTDWITERVNKGFDIVRMSGNTETALTITGVTVTAWDEVTITTSETLQAGDIVYYGMQAFVGDHATGNGGNLCDSQGEDLTATIDQTTVALNNYCLAFTETLA